MYTKIVKVPNISCGHCVRTIEAELSSLENVTRVKADEQTKTVEVNWQDPQNWQAIKNLLVEINYSAEEE